ncbi:DUF2399 domain-containing protein [Myxococcus virescens]|uniref:TIGR02679 family protein n=1 Tax=Myxococcus virescens TaxID=83456 RepID=A0A511H566_9BACT|nr:hypothetical protein MVI01_04600 [Myxococcus virescens]SDE49687.1 TIGR02679 family protein [Myxococcus virescens]
MSIACPLCDGACAGADLGPLLHPRLVWLWEQLGDAADRRGDGELARGSLTIRAPEPAEERAAAGGLLGEHVLKAHQSRRIDLDQLTQKLRVRGPRLTPGAVAAHALRRPLAERARSSAEREAREQRLQVILANRLRTLPERTLARPEPDTIWRALRRTGWIARLLSSQDPEYLLHTALSVLEALPSPGIRADRRRLASDTTGDPHALDDGTTLGGLVLALLVAAGNVQTRQRPRAAWAEAGVYCDDVTGGFIAVGILPVGWTVPPGTALTLPPRVLNTCQWPAPDAGGSWVFVTENPSVASAAADLSAEYPRVRLLCTSGTPSDREIASVARLAVSGWRVAVRADFDEAGLSHVTALLQGVPEAVPWRMGADDYLESLETFQGRTGNRNVERVPDCAWDSRLADAIRRKSTAAFEESLLPRLLEDLRRGTPDRR